MLRLVDKRFPNSMENVSDFIVRWRSEENCLGAPRAYKRSPAGRINYQGADDCAYAFPYAHFDSCFTESIEPLVRPLVEMLVIKNFITYTSCEGHVLDANHLELHVGIVDYCTVKVGAVLEAMEAANRVLEEQGMMVAFKLYTGDLHCKTTGEIVPCLDFYLEGCGKASVVQYMSAREIAVGQFVHSMQ
ncbi:hypothetical protein [Pseudomonas sp. EA_35y_Pfl2_R5]|uniref:hypothetical protein n=1 Tax=Pseudomonas sp. EA_35y_Pfl2_R5 TaxID=3088690 RepID=UPI0030DD177E